jgi:hypothetical protein
MNATTVQLYSGQADRYRTILDNKIAEGARRAASVIETIHQNAPTDAIVPTSRVRFSWDTMSRGILAGWENAQQGLETFSPSDHALAQISERANAPTAYIRELANGSTAEDASGTQSWKRELACEILNKSYANLPRERVLARRVGGQLRGWLSDRYRRLDSRPLVDALAQASQELGAIPVDGSATETRVALKVMMPEIIEPVPGEYLVLGLEWSNSDYGNGTHGVREFVLRVACLNGMTRENLLRQIHLGGRLGDSIEYSDRTLRLDTAASVSALRDTVRGALGPAARSKLADRIRAASDQEASSAMVRGALKGFPKETAKLAADAFDSEDVLNLPAGKTAWRASNAISWIAKNCEDAERRLDLERAAGSVVS